MSQPAWLDRLFATIDARDAAAFTDFLTEDAVFRFGNSAPARGRDDVREAVARFFAGGGQRRSLFAGQALGRPLVGTAC